MPPNSDTAEATVVLPAHLHARPAGTLARTAARFLSTIELTHNGKSANPTGILAVMALGATAGTSITIRAHGTDAHHAVTELTKLLATIT
jgi:phosphotransferase system HPr (HPr) family protein